jgi:arsenite methyltransferase
MTNRVIDGMSNNISAGKPGSPKIDQGIDYGIDAPGLVRTFFLTGSAAALACFVATSVLGYGTGLGIVAGSLSGLAAIYLIGMGCLMLYWSKVKKIRDRDQILNRLTWRGDERVLDIGCGRGLMLIGAALRLTTGHAIGVDIWAGRDQSANTPDGARENARKAGVLQKIEIHTADMRTLPFADRSFDIVMSHTVVHNLERESDRTKTLVEMMRVLRPGGRLILCDIEHRDAYLAKLTSLGLLDCQMMFNPATDALFGALSFGSFRPTTILAQAPE